MPISRLPEKLVVDATAIISALAGGQALRIFERSGIEFATTAFTIEEARFWIDNVVERNGIARDGFDELLARLPLTVYASDVYAHRMAEAQSRIRDTKDAELLALALELRIPVWTNDRDFRGTGVQKYPTGLLLRAMEAEGRAHPPQPPHSP